MVTPGESIFDQAQVSHFTSQLQKNMTTDFPPVSYQPRNGLALSGAPSHDRAGVDTEIAQMVQLLSACQVVESEADALPVSPSEKPVVDMKETFCLGCGHRTGPVPVGAVSCLICCIVLPTIDK